LVEAPVSLFIFNRPEETAKVLDVLRDVKPSTLLVHADAPRSHVAEDGAKCRQVRELVDRIDWPCDVIRNYSERNLGSFERIVSGLDFTFERYEKAIVLEDDCMPDPSFFSFCDELLERYLHDGRISVIGGFSNLHRQDLPYSYFFSRYTMTWGWATWRRMWNLVHLDMPLWPEIRANGLESVIPEKWIRKEWIRKYDAIYEKRIKNGWDYQLQLTGWANNMLAIVPKVNLVRNIGFGAAATHTNDANSNNAKAASSAVDLPLRHPRAVVRDSGADSLIERIHFERNVPRILARQQVYAFLDFLKLRTNS